MISTRILYIAALLSMCSLLAAAFFALRGIRKAHKNVEADLERMAWKAHQEAEAAKAEIEARNAANANSKTDAATIEKADVQISAKASDIAPEKISANAAEIAAIPRMTALPDNEGATPQRTPAYTALLQGILLGAAIVLLARAQKWLPENASPMGKHPR